MTKTLNIITAFRLFVFFVESASKLMILMQKMKVNKVIAEVATGVLLCI